MVDTSLIREVLVVQVALLGSAVTILLLHGVILRSEEWWSRPRLTRGREIVIAALETGVLPPGGLAYLQRLSPRLQRPLFLSIARNLHGAWRGQLAEIATQAGLTGRSEAWCRSRFWWKRLRGARLLSTLGIQSDVIPELLRDRHPAVRVQAAEWAADHPTPQVVESLLALLDSRESLPRYTVQDALLRMGGAAVSRLAVYLMQPGAPGAATALEVARGLADSRLLPAALRLCRDPSPGVRARAAGCVGALGGTEAVQTLLELLADGDPLVRAEAAEALGRLGHWPSAPLLAARLRDQSWPVRREAALALRALGAPGLLFLRRSLADPDPFAADMARQVLDLPAVSGGTR